MNLHIFASYVRVVNVQRFKYINPISRAVIITARVYLSYFSSRHGETGGKTVGKTVGKMTNKTVGEMTVGLMSCRCAETVGKPSCMRRS